MVTLDLLLWYTAICSIPIVTANPCPGVALWESAYEITGNKQNLSAFVWVHPDDGQYVVTCNPSCSGTGPYSATYNNTYSTLHINSVSIRDSGLWKFKDAVGTTSVPVCNLTTANLPACNISSDLDQHNLELGTTLSLTVDVRNYFCSRGAGFTLTAGNTTDVLTVLQSETGANYTNAILNSTFSVTLQRLGDVLLSFSCHSASWDLPCSGVKQLLKSPPTCNITSDVYTDDLELGTEVMLSFDIRNYYCSEKAGFNLTTGRVVEVLLDGHEVDNVASEILNMTFNATNERFGKVLVTFSCDNYNQDLVCDGIKDLVKALPTTTVTTTPPTKPSNTPTTASTQTTAGLSPEEDGFPLSLVVGVYAGVLAFVIIVVVVINRRKITAVARQYIVNRKAQSRPYEQGLDNSHTDPTLDMTDSVAFDEIKLDNVEKVDDSKHE